MVSIKNIKIGDKVRSVLKNKKQLYWQKMEVVDVIDNLIIVCEFQHDNKKIKLKFLPSQILKI